MTTDSHPDDPSTAPTTSARAGRSDGSDRITGVPDEWRAELPVHDPDHLADVLASTAGALLERLAAREWLSGTGVAPTDLLDPAVVRRELRHGKELSGFQRGVTVHHTPVDGTLDAHVQYTRLLGHARGATDAATRVSVCVFPDRDRAYAVRCLRRRVDPRRVERTDAFTVLDPALDSRAVRATPRATLLGDHTARVFGTVEDVSVRTHDAYGDGWVYCRRFPPGGWVEKYHRDCPQSTDG